MIPIEQAYSHFLYATKQAIEPKTDFVAALNAEPERLAAGWQPLFEYSNFPRYADQMQRFFDHFPRRQIFIRTYEDYLGDPQTLMRDLFDFIGADPTFQPDMTTRQNAGGVPKNRALQDFLMQSNPVTRAIGLVVPQRLRLAIRDRIAAANTTRQTGMPEKAREILKARLRGDINRLQDLIGRDLGHWLR
jgi:Sulfotransferase domain